MDRILAPYRFNEPLLVIYGDSRQIFFNKGKIGSSWKFIPLLLFVSGNRFFSVNLSTFSIFPDCIDNKLHGQGFTTPGVRGDPSVKPFPSLRR
jgi:hypothetical protein